VPTPVRRLVLFIGALSATLVLSGAGAGISGADPDETGNSTDPGTGAETGTVSEPPLTVVTPVVPKDPLSQLRDALQRSLSIFGNGRTPGETTETPVVKNPDRPKAEPEPEPKVDPPVEEVEEGSGTEVIEPDVPVIEPDVPEKKPDVPAKGSLGSSAEIRFGAAHLAVPLFTIPWTSDRTFSINLSDPESAFSSVQDTFANLNSLWAEAYAPFNPFPQPPPRPTLRTMEEEPVVDSSGGGGGASGVQPMFAHVADLPVLQAPTVFAAARRGPPRPLVETVPAGTAPRVLGVGTAGVRTAAGRGSVTQGSVQAGEATPGVTTAPLRNTAYRQGFTQSLRTARVAEVATVALPGIAGLLAITASGSAIGYRQANSGRYLRAGADRFLQ
jgi:hypothetical protein